MRCWIKSLIEKPIHFIPVRVLCIARVDATKAQCRTLKYCDSFPLLLVFLNNRAALKILLVLRQCLNTLASISTRSPSNPHFLDAITIFRALTSLHISVHISTIRRSIIFYGWNTRCLVEVSPLPTEC